MRDILKGLEIEDISDNRFGGKDDDDLFDSGLQGMSYYNHNFITIDGPEITNFTTSKCLFSAKEGLRCSSKKDRTNSKLNDSFQAHQTLVRQQIKA